MKILSVSWNPNLDKTTVKLTQDFMSSDWVVRADVLKDVLIEITELYEAVKNENKKSIVADVLGHGENKPKLESVK
jgi:hypothetical protein